jgi:hypothetical protein
MNARRWFLLAILILLPFVGFGVASNFLSGPYNVTCRSSQPRGFSIIFTSWKNGDSTSIPFPFGGCPA